MPELYVTNFNRNFTGVSATTANVVRQQMANDDLVLVGHPLPGCPTPISVGAARKASRVAPVGRPFAIWHVRRNPEMRVALWARDGLRLPVRIVFTSAAIRRHSAYPRWLISRMDAVIATTQQAASFVPHVRAVVPHGVDTDLFVPAPDRAAAWGALGYGGEIGIATIGRIRPEKGTDLFVDAMVRLLPQVPGAVALVIGHAARAHQGFLQGLQDKVDAAGLGRRIRFIGQVAAADLPPLMRGLSLVMQLPRYEGYGMAPLEGMASGVPFVGSDAGYYRAFAVQGKCGVIVAQEAAVDAADAALAILRQGARFDGMCDAARQTALQKFSAAQEAKGIDAVYRQMWDKG